MKVINIEDYLDNKPGRIRRPVEDFDKQANTHTDELADLSRQITTHKKETAIIEKEIEEYQKEAEEVTAKLRVKLFSAGDDYNGND